MSMIRRLTAKLFPRPEVPPGVTPDVPHGLHASLFEALEPRQLLAADPILTGVDRQPLSQSMAIDAADNVYVTANYNIRNKGRGPLLIAKYDAAGDLVWQKQTTIVVDKLETFTAVGGDGSLYIAGRFRGAGQDFDPGAGVATLNTAGKNKYFVLSLDGDGNFNWVRGISKLTLRDLEADAAGNVYLSGSFNGTVDFDPGAGTKSLKAKGTDGFVAKWDNTGAFVWADRLGDTGLDAVYDLAIDTSGNPVIAGSFNRRPTIQTFLAAAANPTADAASSLDAASRGTQAFLVKLDPAAGGIAWARGWGGKSTEFATRVATGPADEIYVGGTFTGRTDLDPTAGNDFRKNEGNNDVFISRFDAAGARSWSGVVQTEANDRIRDLDVDSAGNVVFSGFYRLPTDFDPGAGVTTLTAAKEDTYVVKWADGGAAPTLVFADRFTGRDWNLVYDLAIDAADAIYVYGIFGSPQNDFDPGAGTATLDFRQGIYLAKLQPDGDLDRVQAV